MVKKLSCVSCGSLKRIPHTFTNRGRIAKYSRVPNKRTGRLLENGKKSHLYALIRNYRVFKLDLHQNKCLLGHQNSTFNS